MATTKAATGTPRLGVLLAMAMFVFVIDTSLMNVSISAVVRDLDTTASGVQAAVALEALVSAAFILIGSKVADLIGRKRAYILGLLGYAVGALSMTLSQSLTPIIICWAIIGGLGASLLLPSMQSLIHGNFQGAMQRRAYALVGASAAIATAVAGPGSNDALPRAFALTSHCCNSPVPRKMAIPSATAPVVRCVTVTRR